MFINTQSDLDTFCEQAKTSKHLAVDLEFYRRKTYYAQGCLLQMATPDHIGLVDLMADLDFTPIKDLMIDDNIIKIFHAPDQDLQILYKLFDALPAPIMDTQMMAAFCGIGDNMALSKLLYKLLGKTVSKTQQTSDWRVRPLSAKQLQYAAQDVTDLIEMYTILHEKLQVLERLDWLNAEQNQQFRLNVVLPENAPMPKGAGRLPPQTQGAALFLSNWREKIAKSDDKPRQHILGDDDLIKAAQSPKRDAWRSVLAPQHHASFETALAASKNAAPLPPALPPLTQTQEGTQYLLQALRKLIAHDLQIAERLLINTSDLQAIVRGTNPSDILTDWRHMHFGTAIEALMQGEVSIGLSNTQNLTLKKVA